MGAVKGNRLMLETRTTESQGVRTIDVRGEVDLESSPELWSAISTALSGAQSLRVRMREVTYIDSTGVATLVQGLKHARKQSVRFLITDPSERVRAVMELAQLDRLFEIESTA